MRTKENLVNPDSDYYIYQPSTIASRLYLYPKEIGYFYYEPGYWRSRIQYNSFLLMYIAKGTCQVLLPNQQLQYSLQYTVLNTLRNGLPLYSPGSISMVRLQEISMI